MSHCASSFNLQGNLFVGKLLMNISDLLIDFRITARCHLNCNLCFRNTGIQDSTFDDIKIILNKMFALGFRKIGFTGGEPTCRSDYLHMITYAKSLGFLTYLSTVGDYFIRDLNILETNLDWIGLPIDGIDFATNSKSRSATMGNQHVRIANIFNHLSAHPTTIKLKLTTVVSKANIYHLKNIVNFMHKLPYNYNVWRFYQYCPIGNGISNKSYLEIDEDEFLKKVQELTIEFDDKRISYATAEERDSANVVMEPNFDIIIPIGSNYTYLCNMQHDTTDAIINNIFSRQDVLTKYNANRFWINK